MDRLLKRSSTDLEVSNTLEFGNHWPNSHLLFCRWTIGPSVTWLDLVPKGNICAVVLSIYTKSFRCLFSHLGGALYSDPQGVAQVMIQSFQLSSCAVFNAQMQDVSPRAVGGAFCFTCAFFDSHVPFVINFIDSIIEYWELMPVITVIIVWHELSISSVLQSFYIWFSLAPYSRRDGVYSFSRCSMWAQEACDLLQTSGLYGISRRAGSRTLAVEGSIFLPPYHRF